MDLYFSFQFSLFTCFHVLIPFIQSQTEKISLNLNFLLEMEEIFDI